MVASLFPLQYVIATVSVWLNRQQQEVIDYLKEENLWSANIQSRRFWLVGIFMMQPAQHRFRVHHEALA